MCSPEDEFESDVPVWIDDSQLAISKGFIEYFKVLEDPRMVTKTGHNFLEIIFTAVCAYICGANSWDGVYEFTKARLAWLRNYVELKNGIPSRVTYWRDSMP